METGPITRYVNTTVTRRTITGVRIPLIAAGRLFFSAFSSFAATYTAIMIGITLEVYPLPGMTIGIPRNVL